MTFLDKLKSFFKKQPQVETVEVQKAPESPLGACILCQEPILESDRVKEINGSPVHKRCFKKTQKAIMQGQRAEDVWK